LAAAVFISAGCATEPASILTGNWGGLGLGVKASAHQTEIRLACGAASVRGPLPFDAMGQIDVRTVVNQNYFTYPIRFQARLLNGNLKVTLTEFYPDGSHEVEDCVLIPNAEPDFGGSVCPG